MHYSKLVVAGLLMSMLAVGLYLWSADQPTGPDASSSELASNQAARPTDQPTSTAPGRPSAARPQMVRRPLEPGDRSAPSFSHAQIDQLVTELESEIEALTEHAQGLRRTENQAGLNPGQELAVANAEYGAALKIEVIRLLRSGSYLALPTTPAKRQIPLDLDDGPIVMLPTLESDGERYTPVVQVDTQRSKVLHSLQTALVHPRRSHR